MSKQAIWLGSSAPVLAICSLFCKQNCGDLFTILYYVCIYHNNIVVDKIPKVHDSSATSVRIDEDSEPIAHYSKKVIHIYKLCYNYTIHVLNFMG